MKQYDEGDTVKWKWGDGWGHGKISKVYTRKVTRTIKENEVTRNASDEEPAYLIKQDDDDEVLKSHSEVKKA